jgi:hypothetical protein
MDTDPEPETETPPKGGVGNNGSSSNQTPWPELIEVNEFLTRKIPAPDSIVEGLLDAGNCILFGGASKTFKTWLQVDIAICIAAGMPWLGFKCIETPCLFSNFEVSEYYMQKRIESIKEKRRATIPEGNFHLWNLRDIGDFNRPEYVKLLIEKCERLKKKVSFNDPFYSMLASDEDENKQADMRKALRDFKPITKLGIVTSFGIHFSKGNQAAKEPEDRIGGAGTIIRYVDVVITLTRHKVSGCFTMEFLLRDRPPVDSFVVEWQHPVMARRPDLDPLDLKTPTGGKKDKYDIEILFEFCVAHDDEFEQAEMIKEFMKEPSKWAERTVYNKLDDLKKAKRIFVSRVSKKINVQPYKTA